VHSNLEALESVIEVLGKSVDTWVCLGDIVGYGANPNECVEIVRDLSTHVIAGNHDRAAVGLTDSDYFNPIAKSAIVWTGRTLKEENRKYLKTLELTMTINDSYFVHSSPSNPSSWQYIFSLDDAVHEFSYFREKLCFVGHSHLAFTIREHEGHHQVVEDLEFTLNKSDRYLVNVGSVGQPRDLDARACCVTWDDEASIIRFIRTEYDVTKVQEKIIGAGLPQFLADRLKYGR
jgi:diadenosine tetraphosphatase ApaH/serine/threonine PP2A family protein phosphatase